MRGRPAGWDSGLVPVRDEITNRSANLLPAPGFEADGRLWIVVSDRLCECDGADSDERLALHSKRQLPGHPVGRGGHDFEVVVNGGKRH